MELLLKNRMSCNDSYLYFKYPRKEKKILRYFLLAYIYEIFCNSFCKNNQINSYFTAAEIYGMDGEIIQFVISGIVETGEYTLEGISLYTNIPFDVIYDAACGVSRDFSIHFWAKVLLLYTRVRPDFGQIVLDKLAEIKNEGHDVFLALLAEA